MTAVLSTVTHYNKSWIFMDASSQQQTMLTYKPLLIGTVVGGMRGAEHRRGVAKGGRGQIGREVVGEERMRARGKETRREDLLHGAAPGEANRFSYGTEIPGILLEPEGSLPHSQVHATYPYPETARSSSYPHITLPDDPS
jgi:hypothetical protein